MADGKKIWHFGGRKKSLRHSASARSRTIDREQIWDKICHLVGATYRNSDDELVGPVLVHAVLGEVVEEVRERHLAAGVDEALGDILFFS